MADAADANAAADWLRVERRAAEATAGYGWPAYDETACGWRSPLAKQKRSRGSGGGGSEGKSTGAGAGGVRDGGRPVPPGRSRVSRLRLGPAAWCVSKK